MQVRVEGDFEPCDSCKIGPDQPVEHPQKSHVGHARLGRNRSNTLSAHCLTQPNSELARNLGKRVLRWHFGPRCRGPISGTTSA